MSSKAARSQTDVPAWKFSMRSALALLVTLVAVSFGTPASAQTGSVTGRVTIEDTGAPMPSAGLSGGDQPRQSDKLGRTLQDRPGSCRGGPGWRHGAWIR